MARKTIFFSISQPLLTAEALHEGESAYTEEDPVSAQIAASMMAAAGY